MPFIHRLPAWCSELPFPDSEVTYMYITIGYPWDDIVPSSETNFGLRKWLFLADYPQILDKTVLYGMYIQCLNASFSTPT